ncbi:MAG: (Fe-S)-binding protein [Anaerolineaceae bacterium]|nr:(Fe-S)-binding protein [Anaerolineaceae bacterium]
MNTEDLKTIAQIGNFSGADVPSYDLLIHCMRCGLCLSVCPTYAIFNQEKASPRGRLALIRAVSEERLDVSEGFGDAMNLCVGCLACQTACPAGVDFGHLLESARQQSEDATKQRRPAIFNRFKDFLVRKVVNSPHGLEPLMPLLRFYQKIGLPKLNLARIIPGPLGDWEKMMPDLADKSIHKELGEFVPADISSGPLRGRVGMLTGCLENTLIAEMGKATIRVLAKNGFDVVFPKEQVCCGALPAHIGELDLAREHARQNIDTFETAGVDYVISDAAGCSAQLKEYGHLLADDENYRERAKAFSKKARDVTEFLAEIMPLRGEMQPLNLKVTYDDACHLLHGQGIHLEPREVIQSLPGLEFVELPESDWCCGSGGTYNLTHVPESNILLDRKIENVRKVDPDVLATANTGCFIQLAAGVKKHKLDVEVLHMVQLVDRAYGKK